MCVGGGEWKVGGGLNQLVHSSRLRDVIETGRCFVPVLRNLISAFNDFIL